MIAPALEELAEELGDQVQIIKLDIDENPDAPTKYGVRGIPTMILFKNGQPAATQVGAMPKSGIRSGSKLSSELLTWSGLCRTGASAISFDNRR